MERTGDVVGAKRPIRVLVAKPGLDGHDRGAKVVAQVLRDAGMEVVYLGLRKSPKQIALSAIQEDVDIIGLSILSGTHLSLCGKVLRELEDYGVKDIPVMVGGTIPPDDIDVLKQMGVKFVFPSSTPLDKIVSEIQELAVGKVS